MSDPAKCCKGENLATIWGTKFENLISLLASKLRYVCPLSFMACKRSSNPNLELYTHLPMHRKDPSSDWSSFCEQSDFLCQRFVEVFLQELKV